MIKNREDLTEKISLKDNEKNHSQFLLNEFNGINEQLKQFSVVELEVGKEIAYHIHNNDCDMYYIISGKGIYNDNGVEKEVSAGTITFTPSGEGHALKNTGNDKLVFIALVIED